MMPFQRKLDRAMKWNRDQRMRADGLDPEEEELKEELRKLPHNGQNEEDLPSPEELRQEELGKVELEKGDLSAMILSALVTLVPISLLVLVGIALIAMLLFGGFK